jgi:SAM-dependent methyltransferase
MIRYQQMYNNAVISTWSADTIRPDWDMIIGQVHECVPRGGRILDFGCYTGGLLSRLGAGYERHGIEINKAAAAIVTEKHLAKIWPSIDDIPNELRFDAVIASDVIEHMGDPGQLIDKLFNLVKDNGCLIITTGDADNSFWNHFGANWWYCFYPEHISFISKIWLDRFVQKHDIVIEKCDKFYYCRLSRMRLIATVVMTYFYGYLPSTYMLLNNILRSMLRRPSITSVPGNGVSADHLFIVFVRNGIRA